MVTRWTQLLDPPLATTKRREDPIRLSGCYHLHWRDYAHTGDGHYQRFRYLAVRTSYEDE